MIGRHVATHVARVVMEQFGCSISVQIVTPTLNFVGLQAPTKKKKPLLIQKNIAAYLEFALAHKHWTVNDCKQVIFFDETKINHFTSNGHYWCWAPITESLTSRTL